MTVAARFDGADGGEALVPLSATISIAARSHMSVVGAVSLIVTDTPLVAVVLACRCTQYVSPAGARYWSTIVWPAPGVCAMGFDQSLPTPHTHEFAFVVVSAMVGAPVAALAVDVAPFCAGAAPVNDTTLSDPCH